MGMYYLFYEGEEWKLLIIIYNFRQELMVLKKIKLCEGIEERHTDGFMDWEVGRMVGRNIERRSKV